MGQIKDHAQRACTGLTAAEKAKEDAVGTETKTAYQDKSNIAEEVCWPDIAE